MIKDAPRLSSPKEKCTRPSDAKCSCPRTYAGTALPRIGRPCDLKMLTRGCPCTRGSRGERHPAQPQP
eukprot:8400673-Pyramimonas_sp.AAC.1